MISSPQTLNVRSKYCSTALEPRECTNVYFMVRISCPYFDYKNTETKNLMNSIF